MKKGYEYTAENSNWTLWYLNNSDMLKEEEEEYESQINISQSIMRVCYRTERKERSIYFYLKDKMTIVLCFASAR